MFRENIVKKSNSKIFNHIYFCFFCLLPFIYTETVIDPVLIPRQIYLTVFLFIISTIIFYQVNKKRLIADFSFLKLALPIVLSLFVLLNFLSIFQANTTSEAYYVSSKMGVELLFFIVSTYLIINEKLSIDYLTKSIVVFVFISLLIAIYQLYDAWGISDFESFIYQIVSSFGNKNLFSSILFLALPFVIILALLKKSWRVFLIILLIITLTLLVLIQTRIVLISILLTSLIFYLIIKPRFAISVKLKRILYVSLAVGITSLSLFALTQKNAYFSQLSTAKSVYERIAIWDNSLQMSKDHLWTGVGAGNWQVYFPKYGLENFKPKIQNGIVSFQRPHNDFLWVLCETGILGLVCYTLIFLFVLQYAYKILKYLEGDERKIYALIFAFIFGYILISFVDFPLERIEHQLLFYLLCSITTAKYFTLFHAVPMKMNPITPYLLGFGSFIIILFSSAISIQRFIGEQHTRKMYEAQNSGNWNLMQLEADKSANAFYTMDPMSVPITWYKGVALFSLGNVDGAFSSFEQANAIHPYNIHVMNNIGSCFEIQKKHELAISYYLKALNISPNFEEARLNLSAVYYNSGNSHKAFETIDALSGTVQNQVKYNTYLTAILRSILENTKNRQTELKIISKIEKIQKFDSTIRAAYFLAKFNHIDFEKSIIHNN